MEEILIALLSSPAFLMFIEKTGSAAFKGLFAELVHLRNTDPVFLAQSNAVFSQLLNSHTPEAIDEAHKSLQDLMASRH